jgi:DNA-binding NarL/FixJ family response regulator
MAKTILIADDHDAVRRAICEGFTGEADFEVCGEAHDGRDAIEKAQQLHPDLIVLDLSMPVMNGLEAARVLRELMPSVPIIMFTFYANLFVEEEARSAGVAAVVSKSEPISVLTGKARGLLYRDAA